MKKLLLITISILTSFSIFADTQFQLTPFIEHSFYGTYQITGTGNEKGDVDVTGIGFRTGFESSSWGYGLEFYESTVVTEGNNSAYNSYSIKNIGFFGSYLFNEKYLLYLGYAVSSKLYDEKNSKLYDDGDAFRFGVGYKFYERFTISCIFSNYSHQADDLNMSGDIIDVDDVISLQASWSL